MNEENQGFTVSDRRAKAEEAPKEQSTGKQSTQGKETSGAAAEPVPGKKAPQSPLNFQEFILSLGTSALVHLGEQPLPGGEKPQVNLPHAQEMIDLLSLLQDKTKGNLTSDESRLLSNLLYTLRMKFVELTKK